MPTMSVHDIPDLSDNHDRFLDPSSEGHDIDDNVRHVAATQIDFAMRGTNFQFVQEEIVDHSEAQGTSGSSDPRRLSPTMIVDFSSPSGELSSESLAHNYPSSPHGHAEGTAHPGLNAATQTSQRRERKKEKDKTRKRNQRSRKAQDEQRICDLLEIRLKPKNTLAHRSECLCIHRRLEY